MIVWNRVPAMTNQRNSFPPGRDRGRVSRHRKPLGPQDDKVNHCETGRFSRPGGISENLLDSFQNSFDVFVTERTVGVTRMGKSWTQNTKHLTTKNRTMSEIKAKEADWKVSENSRCTYLGRLGTPKGFGHVKCNDNLITIKVSLKIILNGIDYEKYADVETNEIQDMELAHAWVESLLM